MKIPIVDDFIHLLHWEKEAINHPKLAVIIYSSITSLIILQNALTTYMVLAITLQKGIIVQNVLAILAMDFITLLFLRMTQYLVVHYWKGQKSEK